jgi:hypothetical protein
VIDTENRTEECRNADPVVDVNKYYQGSVEKVLGQRLIYPRIILILR